MFHVLAPSPCGGEELQQVMLDAPCRVPPRTSPCRGGALGVHWGGCAPPPPVEVENFSKLCSTLRAASPLAPLPVEVESLVFIGAVVLPLPRGGGELQQDVLDAPRCVPPPPVEVWGPTHFGPLTLWRLTTVSHFWTLGP